MGNWGSGNVGGGGVALNRAIIIITAPTGSTVTVSYGGKTKTAPEKNGKWTFTGLECGKGVSWLVRATRASEMAELIVPTPVPQFYYTDISYQFYPDDIIWPDSARPGVDYQVVNDQGKVIPPEDYRKNKNWRVRVLNTLNGIKLKRSGELEVFVVGGGGGGNTASSTFPAGGGGYTKTAVVKIDPSNVYNIEIGSGGNPRPNSSPGGKTSAFGVDANGGNPAYDDNKHGGNGGSAGANYGLSGSTDGGSQPENTELYGRGQGSTTREFGEDGATLYATGGEGAVATGNKRPLYANTGDGGHCGGKYKNGQSGICVFRNPRR